MDKLSREQAHEYHDEESRLAALAMSRNVITCGLLASGPFLELSNNEFLKLRQHWHLCRIDYYDWPLARAA